jgi:hypothetical protein
MTSPTDLFEQLEPPPGGREALRARLARERGGAHRRPRVWFAALIAGAACAAALLALWWRAREPAPDLFAGARAHPPAEHYATMVSLKMIPPPPDGVMAAPGPGGQPAPVHLRQIPVDSPSVVLYVASRRAR